MIIDQREVQECSVQQGKLQPSLADLTAQMSLEG